MVCLCRDRHFELEYAGGRKYTDLAGKPIDDLMDMGCVGCGANYYTRESSAIDFCPACGFMERKRFKDYQELQKWSNDQSWTFLKRNGMKAFGVLRSQAWRLTFASDSMELEMTGYYDEVHDLLNK